MKSTVNARKVRAANTALMNAIEYIAESGLREASGDSLLLDDLNNYRRRMVRDAERLGVAVE